MSTGSFRGLVVIRYLNKTRTVHEESSWDSLLTDVDLTELGPLVPHRLGIGALHLKATRRRNYMQPGRYHRGQADPGQWRSTSPKHKRRHRDSWQDARLQAANSSSSAESFPLLIFTLTSIVPSIPSRCTTHKPRSAERVLGKDGLTF